VAAAPPGRPPNKKKTPPPPPPPPSPTLPDPALPPRIMRLTLSLAPTVKTVRRNWLDPLPSPPITAGPGTFRPVAADAIGPG